MDDYRKSSHVVDKYQYLFISVQKYRYQMLVAEVKPRLKDIFTEPFDLLDITVIEGAIFSDHLHMYV